MRNYLEDIFKAILDIFAEAWDNGYLIYFIIALVIFVIIIAVYNRDLLLPVNIFN